MSYKLTSIHCTDEAAVSLITSLYKKGQLYPFLGSGFTKGCKSYKSTVPGVAELVEGIKRVALSNSELQPDRLEEIKKITDLKTSFNMLGRASIIPADKAKRYLEAVFTRVKLPAGKIKILDLDWPGIFTFNIDDAIEENKTGYKKILPNRSVSVEYLRSHRCLFKIHGDISDFLSYEDGELIFTWRQYAESISKNASLLSFLGNVSKQSSLAFIGCSLDAEIDIQSLAGRYSFSRSIYFKVGSLSIEEEIRLEDYGIQTVILFDNYDQIYTWVNDTLADCEIEARIQDVKILQEPAQKQGILDYIAQGGPVVSKSSGANVARIPSTVKPRKLIEGNRRSIATNKYTVIRGRRFSGKTTFLVDIIGELTELHAYFFPSHEVCSQYTYDLIKAASDAIFIFDTNYLNYDNFKDVIRISERNNSKLIFCFDNSDYELYRHYLSVNEVSYHEIVIPNRLLSDEARSYSSRLNSIGLPIFDSSETLLDFAYRVYDEYRGDLPKSQIFNSSKSEELLKVSLLIANFEKATSGQLEACGEGLTAKSFTSRYEILFESEYIAGESGEAIVCNSKPWLLEYIRSAARDPSTKLVVAVSELVASLLGLGYRDTANTLIRFDRLNELLSSEGKSGAAGLIRQIYTRLATACSAIPHYWLQMAKCELMAGRKINEIEDGIRYARKIRVDEREVKGYTYYSATLILAQLMCRKYDLVKDDDLFEGILDILIESFDNYSNNKVHLEKFVQQYKRVNSSVHITLNCMFQVSNNFALMHRGRIEVLKAYVLARG